MDNVFDSNGASWMKIMRKWWGDYLTIGNKRDIENFTYEDMKNVYKERFAHASRVVEVGRKSTEFFTKLEYRGIDKEESKYRFGKRKNIEDVDVASDDKTSVFLFSRKRVSKSDYKFLHVGIEMLTNGLESPYYTELREKLGLTYYVYGGFIRNHSNGVMVINACTDTENADKLKCRMRELVEQTETLLTEERYNTVMSNIKIGMEKNDALLFQEPWRYTEIGGLKLPSSLKWLTYDKVVKTTIKYMKHAVILTPND
jgi:predicted Zn-dependent peptidase